MSRLNEFSILGFIVFLMLPNNLAASSNKIVIKIDAGQRCFLTNGIPDHPTGDFPRRGNPTPEELHGAGGLPRAAALLRPRPGKPLCSRHPDRWRRRLSSSFSVAALLRPGGGAASGPDGASLGSLR